MSKEKDFIKKIADAATKDFQRTGILASITIAQACLESGYGTTDLAKKANALFGIKKHDWKGKTYTKKSYEYEHGKKVLRTSVFRAYSSWQESINDHSNYLCTRKVDGEHLTYKKVVGETDYKKAAKALQSAGYSTYPNYAEMLISLVQRYDLTQYDKKPQTTKNREKKAESKAKPKAETKTKKNGIKIFLDAGHGGKDSGAVSGKRTEKADVLKLVKAIGPKLEAKGFTVGYSRTSDIYETPSKKAQDSNNFKADYFFSFHRNCYNGRANGYENLYYSTSTYKASIMNQVLKGMTGIGFTNRGNVKRTNLAVLKHTKAPALLFEVGFIDNTKDNKIFDSHFNDIVKIYVDAISKNCK